MQPITCVVIALILAGCGVVASTPTSDPAQIEADAGARASAPADVDAGNVARCDAPEAATEVRASSTTRTASTSLSSSSGSFVRPASRTHVATLGFG